MLFTETLRDARWFGGKSRTIVDTREVDRACWVDRSVVSLVEVRYASGPPETYVLADDVGHPAVARALLRQFDGVNLPTERGGSLTFRPTHLLHAVDRSRLEPVGVMRGEQSNTSIRFGDGLILKLFRRVQYGPNPDVEIGWFLTEHTSFAGTPPVAGSLTYARPEGGEASLMLLQAFVPNRGDAWTTTLARLASVIEGADPVDSLESVRRLGQTTAELHLALASRDSDPDFAPEPISARDIEAWLSGLESEVRVAVDALAARDVRVDLGPLLKRARGVAGLEGALKTRHHGDYHLGQVLELHDASFVIIDFEGEPSRPLVQRREKRTPLRDVAGMLRSLDYARNAALLASSSPTDSGRVQAAADWYAAARTHFLQAYLGTATARPGLLPDDVAAPLAALELEKAAYEVLYELNNRPDWLPIPLAAF